MSNINNKNTESTNFHPQTFYIGEKEATVTENGKISIDGKTYSVEFSRGGEGLTTKLTVPQMKELAARVLNILENAGKSFETLNNMTIQSNKIIHYNAKGEEQSLEAGKSSMWATTAQKTIERFKKMMSENLQNPYEYHHDEEPFEDQIEKHVERQPEPQMILQEEKNPKIELKKKTPEEKPSNTISLKELIPERKEPIFIGAPLSEQMSNHKLSNTQIRFVEIKKESSPEKKDPIKNPETERQDS